MPVSLPTVGGGKGEIINFDPRTPTEKRKELRRRAIGREGTGARVFHGKSDFVGMLHRGGEDP